MRSPRVGIDGGLEPVRELRIEDELWQPVAAVKPFGSGARPAGR